MISQHSPLKSIPKNLDRKQAFFVDGIRHAAEICDLSYKRLTAGLFDLAFTEHGDLLGTSYSPYFLDSWAFVDAADRFRCLWAIQPHANNLPIEFSPENLSRDLSAIRDVRNIADHIAQRADHVVSLNDSALGTLGWIAIRLESPVSARSCIVRPGFAIGSFNQHFTFPQGTHSLTNGCTEVRVYSGKKVANLTDSYSRICGVVSYMESYLGSEFSKPKYAPPCEADLMFRVDINIDGTTPAT